MNKKEASEDWRELIWQALLEEDGDIVNISDLTKTQKLDGTRKLSYFLRDIIKDGYIEGSLPEFRITNSGREYYEINYGGKESLNTTTSIVASDFEFRIEVAGKKVKLFEITLTEMDGIIQYINTKFYFDYKKNIDESYEIVTNPDMNVVEVKKDSFLLPLFESWLSLLEDDQNTKQSSTTEKIFNKNTEPITTGSIKHALSIDKSDANLLSKGYGNQGLIGYIDRKVKKGSLPLYSKYQKTTDEYIDLFELEIEDREKGISSDYLLLGYVRVKRFENSILFHRFLNKTDSNNRLHCTNANQQLLSEHDLFEELINSGKVFLDTIASDTNTPLFTYSTQPNLLFFEPIEEVLEEEFETQAEILADNIAIEDELGREGLMEILFKRIDRLWSKLRENESYTVLVNGEWGSGKSSMLYYLEKILSKNKWKVVKYNAWENQRFDEPWWILVNKVSKEVPKKALGYINYSHWFWRNKLQYSISFIVVLIILILAFVGYKNDLIIRSEIKYYASTIAFIGSIWVIINGTIQFLFRKKTYSALHSNTANDPFESVKKRFSKVLKHQRVAIFIDDLDRCEVDATVKLLEGIQTLFKNSKVLYVIAADGAWVANCFDKKYEDFENLVKSGQTIGNEFLQKSFQLVVDVPKISKSQQKDLLKTYLGKKEKIGLKEPTPEVSEKQLESELKEKSTLQDIAEFSADKGVKFKKMAAEKAEKIIELDKRHYTEKLLDMGLIPLNPRQMKRVINLFTLKVQVLIIAGTLQEIGAENVLRYVLFASEYPAFDQQLRKGTELKKIKNVAADVLEILGEKITSVKIKEFL